MEGVLAQRTSATFDEVTAAPGTAVRCDGDAVAPARERPGPQRIARKDVRGSVASPAHGREHRGRPAGRGRVTDRGSTRTASCPSRGRSGLDSRARRGTPSGARVAVAARAEAGALPSSKGSIRPAHRERGQRGRPRDLDARSAMAQGESALDASRAAARRGTARRRSRKHSSPQGARERSRLQKSVRRIFLAARRRLPRGGRRRRGIARGDPAAFDEAAPGSQRATGCGVTPCK
jgi:hypothetical protein